MRVLVDTNVLVAATFPDVEAHPTALDFLTRLLAANRPWCLAWMNVYEYLRVVTHPRVFASPLSWRRALEQVEALLDHPWIEILPEGDRHVACLRDVAAKAAPVSGNFVHDCHLAALMREHDVRRIVTLDSHFRRFPDLEVVHPGEWED